MENPHKLTKQIADWLQTGSINIFGLPFAGKDTHGKALCSQLGGHFISGGDLIRTQKRMQEKAKKIVDQGGLAPTTDYFSVILPELSKTSHQDKPLILSSVGRWAGEEDTIIKVCKESGHPIKAAIYIKTSPEEMHTRFEASIKIGDRGDRNDDQLHKLEKRQYEFETKTMPVIETYQKLGLLIEVDGQQPKEKVFSDILEDLYKKAKN